MSEQVESPELIESVETEQPESQAPAEKDEFSSKFAALSRREKEIRSREKDVETKLAEYQQYQNELKAQANAKKEPPQPSLEYRLKRDPINTLKEMGLDFNTLTELAVNDGKLTPEMKIQLLEQELQSKDEQYNKTIEEKINELRNEYRQDKESAAEQEYSQIVENFMGTINETINDSDEFELCRAEDASDLIYEVIEQHHKVTAEQGNPEIMDIADAAAHVEKWLEEQYKERYSKAKKLKSLFGPQSPEAPESPENRKSQVTLSNTLASQVPNREKKPMSEDDYKNAARAMLKFIG